MTNESQDTPQQGLCAFQLEGGSPCTEKPDGLLGLCFLHDPDLTPEEREQVARNKGAESLKAYVENKAGRKETLAGVHLEGAGLRDAHLEDAYLKGAHLEGATLWDAHLEGAKLWGAHLEGAKLGGVHLEGADLLGAHLERARLRGAHLERSDLGHAHLEGADLQEAHLECASLWSAHLEDAYLKGAHLEGANLGQAHLQHAVLCNAHLEGAGLQNANLECARLERARLERAELWDARLERAHLRGVTLVETEGLSVRHLGQVTPDVEVFRAFKRAFLGMGRYDDASRAALLEKAEQRKQLADKTWKHWSWRRLTERAWLVRFRQWLVQWGLELLCGCFERPLRPARWSAVIVLLFALVYHWCDAFTPYPISGNDGVYQAEVELPARQTAVSAPAKIKLMLRPAGKGQQKTGMWDAVYFSLVTFSTLGYGDFRPREEWRLVAAAEAAIGAVMIAIFVVTLSHRFVAR